MGIGTRIWNDMADTKTGEEYLDRYLRRQRTVRACFKIAIYIGAGTGVIGSFAKQYLSTLLSSIWIGTVQAATHFENNFIRTETQITQLEKLKQMYFTKFKRLEDLWHCYQEGDYDEAKTKLEYRRIRNLDNDIDALDIKLNIPRLRCMAKKAENQMKIYLNRYNDG